MTESFEEETFDQAIRLATAYIASGEIPLEGKVEVVGEEVSPAHEVLWNLIPALYRTVARARLAVMADIEENNDQLAGDLEATAARRNPRERSPDTSR